MPRALLNTFRSLSGAMALSVLALPAFAKPIIETPADVPVLGTAEPYLIEVLAENGGPEESWGSIATRPESRALVQDLGLKLFGGPMLGRVTTKGASFWVRTLEESEVKVVVGKGSNLANAIESEPVRTTASGDLVGILRVDGLKPFTEYHYDIEVDGLRVFMSDTPQFKTFPEPGQRVKFDVAWGACSRVVWENEFIWKTMADTNPLATLFLGDNVYIDEEGNYNRHNLYYYRRQLRLEYRELIAKTAIYAIWDDHDFGTDDVAGGPDPFFPEWKPKVWEIFKRNWINPGYGGGEKQPGVWFKFSIGDVDFFMTDGRYYRSNEEPKSMLGPVQKEWLLAELQKSKATFKVLVSGTLWTEHADKDGEDSWWGFREERKEIFDLIEDQEIGGVFLLSGDRHRAEIFKMDRTVGYELWEFQTGKLTNRHTHDASGSAEYSYNQGTFFGNLEFDLRDKNPTVTFELIGSDGTKLHEQRLFRSDMGPQDEAGGAESGSEKDGQRNLGGDFGQREDPGNGGAGSSDNDGDSSEESPNGEGPGCNCTTLRPAARSPLSLLPALAGGLYLSRRRRFNSSRMATRS